MMIGGQGSAAVVQDTIAATTIARWSRVIYKPGKGRNAPNQLLLFIAFYNFTFSRRAILWDRMGRGGLHISFKNDLTQSLKLHSKVTLFIFVRQENGFFKKLALLGNQLMRLDLRRGLFGRWEPKHCLLF